MKKLFLATTALTALAVTPAHAGPVAGAVAWLGSVLAGGGLGAALLKTALGIGASLLAQALAPKQKAEISVKFSVEMGDDTPLSFILGDYVTAGKRKYVGSWGKDNRYITEVVEVSSVPVPGLQGMWVDDEPANILWGQIDEDTQVQIDWTNSDGISQPITVTRLLGHPITNYADDGNRIWVRFLDGTQTEADQTLVSIFGDDDDHPWTQAMVGAGKAYAIVTTRYDDDTLTQYPKYLFQPQPLPLYDWRKDSTTGGNGPQRWGQPATYQPTRNPAVIAYNIARGIYFGTEWIFGGKNLSAWRLPVAEWTSAANECDAPVSLAGGGSEPQYRCGMEISADMEPASVLEEIGRAANMRFPEVGGRLKAICGVPGSAVLAFTDADVIITEGQSFKPFFSVGETYNALSATYPEPGEKWASKDAPQYVDADATVDDKGRYLPVSVAYGAVPYAHQVQRLMRSQMRDYRRFRTHQFHLPPDAYGLEPGDVVSWTSNRNGYDTKLFFVESAAKTPGMNVLVSLREVDPADYDWSSSFEKPVTITPPVNPSQFVQAIDGLTVEPATIVDADGNGRRPAIKVSCNGDAPGVVRIQIEARVKGTTELVVNTIRQFSSPWAWYLLNVLPNEAYEVRAKLISERTSRNVWSVWHEVVTPDIGFTWEDLTGEVREDYDALQLWADGSGAVIRTIRDEIADILAGVAENDFAAYSQRQEIRTDYRMAVDSAEAYFTDQVNLMAGEASALAMRVQALGVDVGDNAAAITQEQLARADADTALAADITTVETALGDKADASAVNALVTRVEDTEDGLVAQSNAITQVSARTNRGTASGLLRIQAESTPAGVQSRIGLRAEADAGEATHTAAMFLEANSDGTSQVIIAANRFAVASAGGPAASRLVPFVVDGGVVYMDIAMIKDLSVDRLKLAGNSVTVPYRMWVSNTGVSVQFSFNTPDPSSIICGFSGSVGIEKGKFANLWLTLDGTPIMVGNYQSQVPADTTNAAMLTTLGKYPLTMMSIPVGLAAGNHTLRLAYQDTGFGPVTTSGPIEGAFFALVAFK